MDKICRHCGNPYTTKDETDDSYCSFTCWESANCKMPPIVIEEDIVQEILSFKN